MAILDKQEISYPDTIELNNRFSLPKYYILQTIYAKLSEDSPLNYINQRRKNFEQINSLNLQYPEDINPIQRGLLAEGFFYWACIDQGISCIPCGAQMDMKGADFKISSNGYSNCIDVSIDFTPNGFNSKCVDGTYPTFFLSWNTGTDDTNSFERNRLYDYLLTGDLDLKEFLSNTVDLNLEILREIEYCLRNDKKVYCSRVLGGKKVDLSRVGYGYYNQFKAAIILLSSTLR